MKSFTLIEILIYLGLVAVILILIIGLTFNIIYGNVKRSSYQEIQQNARFALEKINRLIRESAGINSPVPGASSDSLSLMMVDEAVNPTIIDLLNNQIRLRQSENVYSLTSDQVVVSGLEFTNLSYENTPGTIKTVFDIEYNNPDNRNEYQASLSLTSTMSLRPGGEQEEEEGGGETYSCQGAAIACHFLNGETCENQDGCVWQEDACLGTCTACSGLNFFSCLLQQGCDWQWPFGPCLNTCTPCSEFDNWMTCLLQQGCDWQNETCEGTVTECNIFLNENDCNNQLGCAWQLI